MQLRELAAVQIELPITFLDDADKDCEYEAAEHDLKDGQDFEQCDWRAA